MDSPYRDFTELVLRAERDVDYHIAFLDRGAPVTVAAIHGGYIEPLTGALARAIAAQDYNWYELQGLRPENSARLRVPVTRFDDLRLTTLMDRSEVGLSIQGLQGQEGDEAVHLGGRNRDLLRRLISALGEAGFLVAGPATATAAHSPSRFVNRPAQGGVQIELTWELRRSMVLVPLEGSAWRDSAQYTARFGAFVTAIRRAIAAYFSAQRSDLTAQLEEFERTTVAVKRALLLPPSEDGGDGQRGEEQR